MLSKNSASPSLRTVNNWISKFKRLDDNMIDPDNQYKWHLGDRDSYSLQSRNLIYRMLRTERTPTNREVYWWLKIKEIRQDISDDALRYISRQCVLNQHKELLGIGKTDWTETWDRIQGLDNALLDIRYVLLGGKYMISYFRSGQQIPNWVVGNELISITQTPENITVVSEEVDVPPDIQVETGWYCLKTPLGDLGYVSTLERCGVDYRVVSDKKAHYVLVRNVSIEWIHNNL